MTDSSDGPDVPAVHRPRTVRTGAPAGTPPTVVRPRTIPALGRPKPIVTPRADAAPPSPPLEAFADVGWQPPTGSVPVVPEAAPAFEIDPDLWTLDDVDAALPTDGVDATDVDLVPAEPDTADEPDGPTDDPTPEDQAAAAVESLAEARSGLLRSNLLVASGTMLSRITGLGRTLLIFLLLSKALGDGYLLANNTPNIIYELILGGVLTATLVPLFTDDLENGDGSATAAVVSFTIVVLGLLTVAAALLSPGLMYLYSLGSPAKSRADFQAVGLRLAILFAPQVFFYGLMALWSAVLNARHRFFAAAWAPVLNNLVVIAVLVLTWRATDGKPTVGQVLDDPGLLLLLGLGTTAGIATMTLSLYPALRRAGVRNRFTFQPRHPAVRKAIRLSMWTFGYVIANQIALLVINILAKPSSGGVKNYQTAYQFFQLPHGLLAVSIMVTFEPLLGRAEARGDRRSFNDQLLLGFRLIGMLVLPAAIAYIAIPKGLDHAIVPPDGTVGDLIKLGSLIAAFAVGLPGFSTYLYAFRGFYAMKDTRTPFWINCLENVINVAAAVVLVRLWGVVGLALAFSFAYTVGAIVAVRTLGKRSPGLDQVGLLLTWGKLLVAGVIMGGFVFGFVALVAPATNVLLLITVVGAGIVGLCVYAVAISAIGVPGLDQLFARLPLVGRGRRSASV